MPQDLDWDTVAQRLKNEETTRGHASFFDADVVVRTEGGTQMNGIVLNGVAEAIGTGYARDMRDGKLDGFETSVGLQRLDGTLVNGFRLSVEPVSNNPNADYIGRVEQVRDGQVVDTAYISANFTPTR
ncbi:MAG: hypothetical protein AB7E85_08435 [Pseudobdellovibrionaceae bacterium]